MTLAHWVQQNRADSHDHAVGCLLRSLCGFKLVMFGGQVQDSRFPKLILVQQFNTCMPILSVD